MAYRKLERPETPGKRYVSNASPEAKVFVSNGTAVNYAFPCWYVEVPNAIVAYHRVDCHDHYGWPDPMRVDRSCQIGPTRMTDESDAYVFPIHLTEEGYDSISVLFDQKPAGVSATGSVDEDDDWIVRTNFSASCPDAVSEKVEAKFSVIASNSETNAKDLVVRGRLIILPGPYQ